MERAALQDQYLSRQLWPITKHARSSYAEGLNSIDPSRTPLLPRALRPQLASFFDGSRVICCARALKLPIVAVIFRDRIIIPPGFLGLSHGHLKRWAEHHVAGFIVPAVLKPAAKEKGDVTLDKVAALTAIILDIDSGDVSAKAAFVAERLGEPTMTVSSGGKTDTGQTKLHLYWLFNEPCENVERVAALRKQLAAKVGGDQSFGRATQVIRVPGSVHAKHGQGCGSALTRDPRRFRSTTLN